MVFLCITLVSAQECNLGDKIRIKNKAGDVCVGCFVELMPNSLIIFNKSGDHTFYRHEITDFYVIQNGIPKYVRIGATIGASFGLVFLLSDAINTSDEDKLNIGTDLTVLALSTLAGALFGGLIQKPLPVNKDDVFRIETGLRKFPGDNRQTLCLKLSLRF